MVMRKAARAIIIEGDKILVMHRNNGGNEYFTLVGGRHDDKDGTNMEDTLAREVMEETGLIVTKSQLVFIESHPKPYNEQYIYLCEVAPHEAIAIQDASEEALLNKISINLHEPLWAITSSFSHLQFRTPQLQAAIIDGVKNGFPSRPLNIS